MRRRGWAVLSAATAVAVAGTQRWLTDRLRAAEEATRTAEAHQRALRAVVEAAGTAALPDVQGVLDTVTAATAELGSDMAALYRIGDDGMFHHAAVHNIPEELAREVIPPNEGLAGEVVRTGSFVHTNDYRRYAHAMRPYVEVSLRAAMGAPITVDGRVIGALVAGRQRPGGFDAAEVTAFELLAAHAGRALALAELIDEDRRALAQLRRLHELQADFVATVSHELRTPLTVIDGVAETLSERGALLPTDVTAQLLRRLRANTTALTAIVTSLLEAARLDRGLVEVDRSIVDFAEIVRAGVDRIRPLLADHDLHVSIAPAHVLGDAALLDRVVENLLANAARHTPPGTRVEVSVLATGSTCVLEVRDEGPGIPPDDLAHITERFRRAGDHHTRDSRGLGLGLSLTAEVLRLHGTRLRCESTPGAGSTFGFTLPTVDPGWYSPPAGRQTAGRSAEGSSGAR